MGNTAEVVWDESMLGYDMGDDHPLNPVRLHLTIQLASALGVLDGVTLRRPDIAGDDLIERVHQPDYLAAVRAAPDGLGDVGHGLGTSDNPVFAGMHEASALVVGGSVLAADLIATGQADRAVNIAGGLHHAMPDRAAGFCVYNDCAVAISWLLDHGIERVAYVDVDVHHGDGVQTVFYDDPRVLTISLHQHPRTLWPGTGYPSELGTGSAEGTSVNLPLPPGTTDRPWLRAFHAVVPSALRAFKPQILFSQCGADTYRIDPLADLRLSVDGQRASYLAMRDLAEELCEGRWIATGGGGYALFEAVPRAWTHLLAIATGEPLDPSTPTPPGWRELAAQRLQRGRDGGRARVRLLPGGPGIPSSLTDGASTVYRPWQPGDGDAVDRAILATRQEVFPLLGLDPLDPRD